MLKDFFVNTSIYDEAYDCYLCLENWILYRTVNGDGYKEYQSRGEVCANCQDSINVRKVKKYVKTVIRHIWEEYMEMAEDIGNKEIYEQRKETSERIFGTVKE